MSEDRWVRIVDPQHVLRAAIDEVWHPVHYPQHWCPVDGLADGKCGVRSLYKARCRLRDVPPGTKIVDPGPEHELVEPWEVNPDGYEDFFDTTDNTWNARVRPVSLMSHHAIYRRRIRKPWPDQFAATTAAFRKAMEAPKTPQSGEWWFANDGSGRAYMHAFDQFGKVIYEFHTGVVYSKVLGWSTWHHEPACTGWDWQPPQPEAEPEAEPEPLTLEQRVEAMEQRLKKLEYQVSEWEDSQ